MFWRIRASHHAYFVFADCSSVLNQLFRTRVRLMESSLINLLIAANVGIMVFFTVAVAPTIFTALPPQWSAAYVRKFFPRYFLFLGVTTSAALGLAVSNTYPTVHQWAMAACALIFFFNCFWLTPRINQARDDGEESTFKSLHWASVTLNMIQLSVFVWLLVPSGSL
jgi:hypothetical protein